MKFGRPTEYIFRSTDRVKRVGCPGVIPARRAGSACEPEWQGPSALAREGARQMSTPTWPAFRGGASLQPPRNLAPCRISTGSAVAAQAPLDPAPRSPLIPVCQLAGRPLPGEQALRPDAPGGGKSGLQGSTVAANGRRGRPQGKCHRDQTARAGQPAKARVKRCGKSAPRSWQQGRHGKPHREQDRIGAAGRRAQARRPGGILAAVRVGC